MDMAALGKIAGIGGIALGAMVLLIRAVLSKLTGISAPQRAGMFRLIIVGVFGIGALGILAWSVGAPAPVPPSGGGNTTTGPQSPIMTGPGATVNYGQPPATAPGR